MDDCQGKLNTTESIVLLTAHGQNTIEHMYSEALQNKMTSYKNSIIVEYKHPHSQYIQPHYISLREYKKTAEYPVHIRR